MLVLLIILIAGICLVSIDSIINGMISCMLFIGMIVGAVFLSKRLSKMEDDNIYRGENSKNDMFR
ncbi:hypothetical protein [Ruminococcus flavefaciens]|uniref:hypothetical protein n=1 Tax=Ruminococcus flavefaciens TaxID=1265 RepID=UPI0026F12F16|nr:hypothetical protein [Ruminococcus flavefaciens]